LCSYNICSERWKKGCVGGLVHAWKEAVTGIGLGDIRSTNNAPYSFFNKKIDLCQ
jgi:hypothetical protein